MKKYILFLIFVLLADSVDFGYPMSFALVRNMSLPLNASAFLNKTGCCKSDSYGNQIGYNIISIDGFQIDSTISSLMSQNSPLSIWLNAYSKITNSRLTKYGTNNSQVQQRLIKQYHDGGVKLLFNAFFQEYPVSNGASSTILANNINNILQSCYLDGVSIQFNDFDSVLNGLGWSWLQSFLLKLRNLIKNKVIILILPSTLAAQIDRNSLSGLADYFVLVYYGFNKNDYTSMDSLLTNSSQYKSTAFKQILQKTNRIDMCRTLISKPVLSGNGYIDPAILGNIFTANGVGWFGGYANLDFQTDNNQMFQMQVLEKMRIQCLTNLNCKCY